MATVVLKKYGNRRLYDTERSTYVTLAEVEELLQQGRDVEVKDAKTGEDLTRQVLVQIIAERPESRDVLPLAFLKEAIRKSASPDKGQFQEVLMGWVQALTRAQRGVLDQMQQLAETAARAQAELRAELLPVWRPFAPPPRASGQAAPSPAEVVAQSREPRSRDAQATGAQSKDEPGGDAGRSPAKSDLDDIRAELAETQSMLRQLIQQQASATGRGSREPEE